MMLKDYKNPIGESKEQQAHLEGALQEEIAEEGAEYNNSIFYNY